MMADENWMKQRLKMDIRELEEVISELKRSYMNVISINFVLTLFYGAITFSDKTQCKYEISEPLCLNY
jgi:hypothetical protein